MWDYLGDMLNNLRVIHGCERAILLPGHNWYRIKVSGPNYPMMPGQIWGV